MPFSQFRSTLDLKLLLSSFVILRFTFHGTVVQWNWCQVKTEGHLRHSECALDSTNPSQKQLDVSDHYHLGKSKLCPCSNSLTDCNKFFCRKPQIQLSWHISINKKQILPTPDDEKHSQYLTLHHCHPFTPWTVHCGSLSSFVVHPTITFPLEPNNAFIPLNYMIPDFSQSVRTHSGRFPRFTLLTCGFFYKWLDQINRLDEFARRIVLPEMMIWSSTLTDDDDSFWFHVLWHDLYEFLFSVIRPLSIQFVNLYFVITLWSEPGEINTSPTTSPLESPFRKCFRTTSRKSFEASFFHFVGVIVKTVLLPMCVAVLHTPNGSE